MNIIPERRRSRRHLVDAAVSLSLPARPRAAAARLADLSHGGCFLRSGAVPVVNAAVSLTFYRGGQRLCSAAGTVARTTDDGFGVRFVDLNDALKDLVFALGLAGSVRRAELLAEVAGAEITVG